MFDSEEDEYKMFQQNIGQYSAQGVRQMDGNINLRRSSDKMFGDTNLQRCRTQMYELTNSVQDDRHMYERVTTPNSSKQMYGDTRLQQCPTEMYELANTAKETTQTYKDDKVQRSYDLFPYEYKNVGQDSMVMYKNSKDYNSFFGETRSDCFGSEMSYEERKLGLQIANSTEELYSQFTEFASGFDKLHNLHSLCHDMYYISLFLSDYWLRQAGVLDDDFITCDDTSLLYWDKFGDSDIDFPQWLEYVEQLCYWKQLDQRTVKMLLISCGHLGEKPVVMPKSLPEYYRPYVELCTTVDSDRESYFWCRDIQTSTTTIPG